MSISLEDLKKQARKNIVYLSSKNNKNNNRNRTIRWSTNTKDPKENERSFLSTLINNEYLNQPSLSGNWHKFYEELKTIKTSTLYIEYQYSKIHDAIVFDKQTYQKWLKEFEIRKKSFLQKKQAVEEQLQSVREEMNSEMANTKSCRRELEECERAYENVKNEIPALMTRIMVPEACYMITTWLSPLEWKRKINVDKLSDEFARFDSYLTVGRSDGCLSYVDYIHQKSLKDFANHVRKTPVLEMYWESVDQFSEVLATLNKQAIHRIVIPNMISKSLKASAVDPSNGNKTKRSKRQFTESMKRGLLQSMRDQAAKTNDENEEIVFIHTDTEIDDNLMYDIYTELDYPIGDFNKHYEVIELLFVKLYEALDEVDDIPADQWSKTEEILRSAERHRRNEFKTMKHQRNVIKTVRHEAHKMYELPATDVRKQKIMPYRRPRAKQKQPKEPEKPKLNDKQLMYLKCYTHLLPGDIADHAVTSVPEIN